MYDVTRDPLALGLVGLAEAAPFIAFALYAGHVADVRDRRRVALAALVLLFLCAVALAVATRAALRAGPRPPGRADPGRHLCDHRRLRRGAQLSAARAQRAGRRIWSRARCSRARSRGGPASGRSLPSPGRRWAASSTRGSARRGRMRIAAALMAASLVTVARIRVPARPPSARAQAPIVASVREGLAFLFKRPIFLGAITLDLVAVLFGGAVAILPIFAGEILHVGPARPRGPAGRARHRRRPDVRVHRVAPARPPDRPHVPCAR